MEGTFYFAINYPSFFQIKENSSFSLKWNEVDYVAIVHKHLLPVEVLDFQNSIVQIVVDEHTTKFNFSNDKLNLPDDYIVMGIDPLYTIIDEKSDNLARTRRYTKLLFGVDCIGDYTKTEASKDSSAILNHFIQMYKLATGDTRVSIQTTNDYDVLVGKEGFHEYTDDEKILSPKDRLQVNRAIRMGIKYVRSPDAFTQVPGDLTKNDEYTVKMNEYVDHHMEISFEQELYLKAMDECYIRQNFKYAVIELFLIVEIVTGRVLEALKKNRGISNKTLKNFERNVSISYLLNIELPMVFKFSEEQKEVLNQVDMLRSLRNKIVHDGYIVTEEEVKPYFSVVSAFNRVLHQVHTMNVTESIQNALHQASLLNDIKKN